MWRLKRRLLHRSPLFWQIWQQQGVKLQSGCHRRSEQNKEHELEKQLINSPSGRTDCLREEYSIQETDYFCKEAGEC